MSKSGSDANTGTVAAPWLTIQKAANTMVAGDTTYIEAGTYRETVKPLNSGTSTAPITFAAYGSDRVVVSGLDVVNTTWSQYSGSIYATNFALGMGDMNQVFVDSSMGDLARWPNNVDGDPFTPDAATVGSGSSLTTIHDASMPNQGTDFYKGAIVWCQADYKWTAWGATITGSGGGNISFTIPGDSWVPTNHNPGTTQGGDVNRYYIAGALGLLDTAKEWYYDSTAQKLYLWVPGGGNPSANTVEVKARQLAFDLSSSYINLSNLNVNGGEVSITGSNNNIDGMTGTYMAHRDAREMSWNDPVDVSGVYISGANNTIKNGNFAYSSGNMISVYGSGTVVDNNYISHSDYNGCYDSAIVGGTGGGVSITRNTISTSGRALFQLKTVSSAWDFERNDLSDGMRLTDDGGLIYTSAADLKSSIVGYNNFHDMSGTNARKVTPAVYIDDGTSNIFVHHAVIYNIGQDGAVRVGGVAGGIQIHNITTYNCPTAFIQYHNGGSATILNIFHNQPASNFVNAANHDFRLTSTSTAIDAGGISYPWPWITDLYVGANPDLGAYEYGGCDYVSNWTAGVGANLTPSKTINTKLTGTVIGTAGSWNNSGNTRDMAFDGNTSTFFDAPSPDGAWTGLDLGSAGTIAQIKYAPRATYASRMVGGVFQGSNTADFSSGVVNLYTITNAPPDGQLTAVSVNNSSTFRYVRYLAPAGGYGNVAEVEFWGTAGAVTTPPAPSNLSAVGVSSSQINLSWTDNSTNETGFKIERATDSGFTQNLTLVTTTAAHATSYSDTALAASTTYYYRVRATNSAGDSGNSNIASAATSASSTAVTVTQQNTTDQWTARYNGSGQHDAMGTTMFNGWGTAGVDGSSMVVTNGVDYGVTGNSQGHGLLQFVDLFGSGVNQIPANATIQSATLTLNAYDASAGKLNGTVSLYALNTPWLVGPSANNTYERNTSATYAGGLFGSDGITPGTETVHSTADASATLTNATSVSLDVTSSLRSWLSNPAANDGWGILVNSGQQMVFAGTGGTYANSPRLQVTYIIPQNLAANQGFETGSFSSWTTFGTVAVVNTNQHGGAYASKITGGSSGFSQMLTGLLPNTTYQLTAWVKGEAVNIGVKNYGGTEIYQTGSGSNYTQLSVTFTTGSSSTSAEIYAWKPSGVSDSFVDDFAVIKL